MSYGYLVRVRPNIALRAAIYYEQPVFVPQSRHV
jgi:hypothetical protein